MTVPATNPEPARCPLKHDLSDGLDSVLIASCGNTEPGHVWHFNKRYGVEWSDSVAAYCPIRGPGYRPGGDGCRHVPAAASAGVTPGPTTFSLPHHRWVNGEVVSATAAETSGDFARTRPKVNAEIARLVREHWTPELPPYGYSLAMGDLIRALQHHSDATVQAALIAACPVSFDDMPLHLQADVAQISEEKEAAEAALAARDAEHADALTLERATYASGTITLGVGPEGCQPGEWDCEEYQDADGNRDPAVELCGHIVDDVWTADRLVELIEKADGLEAALAACDAELRQLREVIGTVASDLYEVLPDDTSQIIGNTLLSTIHRAVDELNGTAL